VICTGWGMGETHLGAYAERARVKGDWLVPLPDGLSAREAMASAPPVSPPCWRNGARKGRAFRPDSGPVVVTGAAGGVGSFATAVLSNSAITSSPRPAACRRPHI